MDTKHPVFRTFLLASVLLFVLATCKQAEKPEEPAKAPEPQQPAAQVNLPPSSWTVPVDVSPTPPPNPPQNNYLQLGWQTFVALNWPAVAPTSGGQAGQPNTMLTIGARSGNGALVPTVWSTFRDLGTIMLDGGANPGANYTQPVSFPTTCGPIGSNPVAPGFPPLLIDGGTFASATIPLDYVNQATGNPLVSQNGWYTITEIRMNQSEYAFIQQNAYYVGQNQVNAYKTSGQLKPFPKNGTEISPALPPYALYGALEVKATWRVLDPVADKAILPR